MAAFTPTPPSPANAPPHPGYTFFNTDDGTLYSWDGANWVAPSGSGTVTNTGTLTDHALIVGNGGVDVSALGSLGTTTTVLHGNAAGDPTFSAVDLAADVTGDLPYANLTQGSALSVLGVTGNATADNASIAAGTDHQVLRRSGTAVDFGAVNLAQAAAVTGTLVVANGGTGAATLAAHGVIIGNGTSAVAVTSAGSSGQVLTSNGASSDPTFQASSGGAFIKIEEQTPSGTGTLTFSSLGAYTNLRILWNARSTDTSISVTLLMRFNADTGSNYDIERLQGSAGSATAAETIGGTSMQIGIVTAATGSGANQAGSGEIVIYDYAGTTFEKNAITTSMCKRANSTNNIVVQQFAASWRSTSAITSVTLLLGAGNYTAGSKFSLYGIT